MPGLLRGVARTAAVAGTATAVSNRVERRQYQKWAQQGQQTPYPYTVQGAPQAPEAAAPAPAPAAPAVGPDLVTQLKELAALKEQGILTEEEFAAQKAKLLG